MVLLTSCRLASKLEDRAISENRRSELAKLGLKALIGGTLASLLSATIAGFFL